MNAGYAMGWHLNTGHYRPKVFTLAVGQTDTLIIGKQKQG
jgi:hypothetical protein